jgi:hypothetical protein
MLMSIGVMMVMIQNIFFIRQGCGPGASQVPTIDYDTCFEAKRQTRSGPPNGRKMFNAAK